MPASVIIPAYQAASTLGQTVAAARSLRSVAEVIVVDDGSHDDTAEVARRAGADQVIRLARNRGKGAALWSGVQAAHHPLLLFLDADLEHSAAAAAPLLQVQHAPASIAVAFAPHRPGAAGLGLARGLARAAIRLLAGLRMAEPMSGQRAIPTALVAHIGIAPRFGAEVGLTVEAAHLGLPVVETCVQFTHQRTGRTLSGFLHRGRQFADILQFLLLTGYGLGWPALPPGRILLRIALWFAALILFIALGTTVSPSTPPHLAVMAGIAILLWLPTLWVGAVSLGLRKRNYLGRPLPAAAGLLFPVIALPALWLSPLEPGLRAAGLVVVAAFAAVGLLDDLFAGKRQARGLTGHLLALARGRPTTGALKAIGGLAAGTAAGYFLHPNQPALIALDALLISLSANFLNLLDLRPSRALKGWFLLCALTLALSPHSLRLLGPLLAAAIVSAPADFAGRTMMGDVGSNVLGAAAGLGLAVALDPWGRLVLLLTLIALHIVCERASLTEIIAHNRFLTWLDRLGTAHLAPFAGMESARR